MASFTASTSKPHNSARNVLSIGWTCEEFGDDAAVVTWEFILNQRMKNLLVAVVYGSNNSFKFNQLYYSLNAKLFRILIINLFFQWDSPDNWFILQ